MTSITDRSFGLIFLDNPSDGLKPLKFENFIKGKSNLHAFKAAKSFVNENRNQTNSLVIYQSNTGAGTTHLMVAIGFETLLLKPNARVALVYSDVFVGYWIKAIKENKLQDLIDLYLTVDLLLIDDIIVFSRSENCQQAFIKLLKDLLVKRKKVIMTTACSVPEIQAKFNKSSYKFLKNLPSTTITTPDPNLRFNVLKHYSLKLFDKPMSDEYLILMSEKLKKQCGSIRMIKGFLLRLRATSVYLQKPISRQLIMETLSKINCCNPPA